MRAKTRVHKKTRAFTLIELLVVIAVITMLLSMLMPSLKAAKEKSRQVVCSTNLHTLITAWEMYSQNNNYKVCPPFTGGADGSFLKKNWVNDGIKGNSNPKGGSEFAIRDGLLWPQVGDIKTYHCPTDKSKRFRSYALSFSMGGGQGAPSGGGPGSRIISRDGIKPVTKVPRTSGKLVFIDSEPGCLCSNKWIGGSFIPMKANVREWNRISVRSDMTMRHSGGCNVAFADGSCSSWKWKDPGTINFIKDKTILAQGAIGNEDFTKVLNALTQ
ncbi:MAG: prepilin-type N-terminal cleavage/methylation domain-containing protein [Planctomycetes bacterium]|nr:prepilin-type N-terminal cleavage/methylation domain-containing protein [Planctomycetota bacterium]